MGEPRTINNREEKGKHMPLFKRASNKGRGKGKVTTG